MLRVKTLHKRVLSIVLSAMMMLMLFPAGVFAEELSSDATLSSLAAGPYPLTPSFSSDRADYTVNVPYEVSAILFGATSSDPNATIVGITEHNSLSVGANECRVIVTAQDGTTSKTYTITVTRAARVIDKSLELDGTLGLTYDGTEAITAGVLPAGSYTWNSGTGILTLNGVNFTTSAATALDLTGYSSPLTLNISGSNSFVSTYNGDSITMGIWSNQTLNITGNGTLNVTGGATSSDNSYGLYINDDVNITGGTLTATGGTALSSYGIRSFNLSVSGGTVTATGGESTSNFDSIGIEANSVVISGTADVTATGTTAYDSYGVKANEVSVSGGALTAEGGTAINDSYGINVGLDGVNISGGTVTATGGAANSSYGIYHTLNKINIHGGTHTASGNTAALFQAHNTLPAAYTWSANGSDPSSSEYSYSALHKSLTITTATAATPATYTFNKAVSSETLFEITYTLAPGVSFNNIVKNGTTTLTPTSQWVVVDSDTIEITSSYLMGLAVGTYTITLDTTAATDPTVALTVTNIYDKELELKSDGLYYNDILLGNSDSKLGGGSYTWNNGTSTLTLNNVNFTNSAGRVLSLSYEITLTLIGDNSLISTNSLSSDIVSDNNLIIGGSGSLTLSSEQYGIISPAIIAITGGTINANGGLLGVSGNDEMYITGGSINATMYGTPKDAVGGNTVYKTTLTGLPANTAVTAFSKTYGITGVKTDADGKLYFYLPRSDSNEYITLTIGGTTYYGTIPAGNEAKTVAMSSTFTATEQLILTSEGKLTYAGFEIPQNTASPILGGGNYSYSLGTLTITDVVFRTTHDRAFRIELQNVTIYQEGNNIFESLYDGSSTTVGIEARNIILSGSGSLSAISGNCDEYIVDTATQNTIPNPDYSLGLNCSDITLNSGSLYARDKKDYISANYGSNDFMFINFTVNGGNICINNNTESEYNEEICFLGNSLTINGGSINFSSIKYWSGNDCKNSDGEDVYLTTLTGLPANTAVSAFSKTYGITGVKTDADGKLYFYLPRAAENEAISITLANGKTYSGIIPTGNEAKTVAMAVPTPEPAPAPTPAPEILLSDNSSYSPPPPIPNSVPNKTTVGYNRVFRSKSGINATAVLTEKGVVVTAGLNKSGSVNSEATAAAVAEAAKIARANGEERFTIAIPAGATGLSAATIEKLVKAADGLEIVLSLTSNIDGEEVGSISLPINAKTGQILTGLYFETERIYSIQNYIAGRYNADILGSFETAQKGGWGAVATLSVSTHKLGFTADDGEKLYAIIYDTKTGKMYQVPAAVEDGNVIIKTKRTGIVTIVTKSVK